MSAWNSAFVRGEGRAHSAQAAAHKLGISQNDWDANYMFVTQNLPLVRTMAPAHGLSRARGHSSEGGGVLQRVPVGRVGQQAQPLSGLGQRCLGLCQGGDQGRLAQSVWPA